MPAARLSEPLPPAGLPEEELVETDPPAVRRQRGTEAQFSAPDYRPSPAVRETHAGQRAEEHPGV